MTGSGVFGLWFMVAAVLPAASIILTTVLISVMNPLLSRYAVVIPNKRSSHKIPTPQGAGLAVIAATILVVVLTIYFYPTLSGDMNRISLVLAAAVGLAAVGAADDIFALEVLPRLLLQVVTIGAVIIALPAELRIVPFFPWWIERALLLIASLWFINLVNFMDGIDWMTVAEVVPITGGLAIAGIWGALPSEGTIVALALLGAVIGFAPYNKPVARLFLGDVGSLPIGLLICWLLILLAGNGHLAASILLPLYYLADASITLLCRLARREPILQAHRTHFYQRATDRGLTVMQIVTQVFILNLALVAFALGTILFPGRFIAATALLCGGICVTCLLLIFASWKTKR